MSEQIKETEIMIGNWFIGYDDKPFRWSIKYFTLLALEKNAPTIDELIKSPVPLTEDILLKCGFEKCRKGYSLNVGGESFDYYIKDEFVLWYHKNRGYSLDTISKSSDRFYNYLHTLQNLFKALTQTDLKVNI